MNVALIPVRGGSKSIPLKNIKEMAGKPLVYWVAKAANNCRFIDKVYIATDAVSTESVMLEFSSRFEFENIVLVQATSPLLTSQDLNKGFELYQMKETDSVLSVVKQKRFQWKNDEHGYAVSVNYDYRDRPRRQDFEGYLVENGAFYITGKQALIRTENRLSGKIRAYEMDESTYFEIDEPSDWEIIEKRLFDRLKSTRNS